MPRMPTIVLMTGHVHRIVSGQPRGPENGVANQPTATSMIRNDVTSGQYRGFQRESLLLSLLALRGPNELSAARNCAALSSESSSCDPQDGSGSGRQDVSRGGHDQSLSGSRGPGGRLGAVARTLPSRSPSGSSRSPATRTSAVMPASRESMSPGIAGLLPLAHLARH